MHININDYEEAALARLPQMVGDYYRSGSRSERTLRENRDAFANWCLNYRVLVDVSQRSAKSEILGRSLSMPVITAPTAFHKLAHPDGEVATATGTRAAGTTMVLSTLSNSPIEEVAAAAEGELWFQLYVYKDRGRCKELVERAKQAGAKALVVTVDAALLGTRERDIRNGFHLPKGLSMPNVAGRLTDVPAASNDSGLAAWVREALDPTLSWSDIGWLAEIAGLPVLVKGVCRADDAVRAMDSGAAGVVVSNHGGRQLDAALPTVEALPAVAQAIGHRGVVLLDGGIRRGTDVMIALALGADAVMVGRPVLWGLAVDGAQGVQNVLTMLRDELDEAQALAGAPTLPDITRDLVVRNPGVTHVR